MVVGVRTRPEALAARATRWSLAFEQGRKLWPLAPRDGRRRSNANDHRVARAARASGLVRTPTTIAWRERLELPALFERQRPSRGASGQSFRPCSNANDHRVARAARASGLVRTPTTI